MRTIITKKFISTVALTAVVSVIVNICLLAIVRPIAGAPATFSPFHYWPVIELTFLGVLAAGFVYAGIERWFPSNYRKVFIWVAAIALLASLVPDLLMPYSTDADNQGATAFVVCMLMLMHTLTAVIVVGMFTKKRP